MVVIFTFKTTYTARRGIKVTKALKRYIILGYLRESNAAAHCAESDIF